MTRVSRPQWIIRYPLGLVDGTRSMGTVAAPMFAGFGFATIAVLITAEHTPPLSDFAIAAFAVGSVMMAFCVQFTAAGLLYSATPDERIAWAAGREADPSIAERIARVQRMDHDLQGRYFLRSRITYDVGVMGLFLGLVAVLYPARWTVGTTIAFVVAGAACTAEIVWLAASWSRRRPRTLLPSYAHAIAEEYGER